jgi:hypothetical protein
MGDNEDPVIDLATAKLSIIAIAGLVVTLVCFDNSSALAQQVGKSGNYWHQLCARQSSADVLQCRIYLQGLHDGLIVGRRTRTALRMSPTINDCWQARGGRHDLRRSGNGTGNAARFDLHNGPDKRGLDAFRHGVHVHERPSMHVSDAVATARLFHVPRWREA